MHNTKNTLQKEIADFSRVLCVRPDTMGDVLMCTPAFRALKETFPQVSLTLLTSQKGNAITPFIPFIDDTILFDVPWEKNNAVYQDGKQLRMLIETLKQKKFDAAIIFTSFSQDPLPAALI